MVMNDRPCQMKTTAFTKLSRVLALFILCCALPARAAATFIVTTNSDSGPGSLRQAIADANAAGEGTISFSNVSGTITLTSSELSFTGNLTLVGPGPANLAVSGMFFRRVLNVYASSTSSISGITIRDGRRDGADGGGVYNAGSLLLSNCTVTGNYARQDGSSFGRPPVWGGGIFNVGILMVNNSRVIGNGTQVVGPFSQVQAPHGGGIYNLGTLLLTRSSLAYNFTADGYPSDQSFGPDGGSGGGLYNAATATLIDCTISGNRCGNGGHGGFVGFYGPSYRGGNGGSGGGIYSSGTLYLTNCTIDGNASGSGGEGGAYVPPTATKSGDGGNAGDGAGIYKAGVLAMASCTISRGNPGAGGIPGNAPDPTQWGSFGRPARGSGIWNQTGTVQVANSLIASNAASLAPDVGGAFASQGHNLIGNTNGSVGFPGSNDLLNLDPKLGPLTNNGSPTLTCALLVGSPAIDAGDDSLAGIDQRGFPRPSGLHVDIGAFEVQIPNGAPCLIGPERLGNNALRFAFTNTPGASFTVLATTNVAFPSTNWTVLGSTVENTPGWFQYTDTQTTNDAQRFYQIRWP